LNARKKRNEIFWSGPLINQRSSLILSRVELFLRVAPQEEFGEFSRRGNVTREEFVAQFDQMTIKVSLEQMSCAKVVRLQVRPVHLAIVAAINNALGAIAFGFRLPEMASARKLVGIC